MKSGNIIEINVANMVSILIMAVVGGFVMNALRKFIAQKRGASQEAAA